MRRGGIGIGAILVALAEGWLLGIPSRSSDDTMRKRSQGTEVPDAFTRGSSKRRVSRFRIGMESRQLSDCDTFARTESRASRTASLPAIGQTPGRESDKRRLAFRTEADSEGWRAGLSCE